MARRMHYLVRWEIEVDAESPQKAAEEALEIMRDPESTAVVFDVFDPTSTRARVDLDDHAVDRQAEENYRSHSASVTGINEGP